MKDKLNKIIAAINTLISYSRKTDPKFSAGEISDGYHSFNELYDYRKTYNALLFKEWASYDIPKYDVHRSKKHHDGEPCFGGEYFVVTAMLPTGQISNHYKLKYWDDFDDIPEEPTVKWPYDGHSSEEALERMEQLLKQTL